MSSTVGMLGKGYAEGYGRVVSIVRIWPWMASDRVLYAEVVLMMRKREPHGPVYLSRMDTRG